MIWWKTERENRMNNEIEEGFIYNTCLWVSLIQIFVNEWGGERKRIKHDKKNRLLHHQTEN